MFELLGSFQDRLFAFLSEARQIAKLAFAGELFQVRDRGHFEFLPQQRHALRAERRNIEKLKNSGGIFFQQFLAEAVIAGGQNFADVLGHAFADAGKLLELLFILGDILDALGEAAEQIGDFFIAAVAADDGAINFEQLRGFAENFCNVAVVHGYAVSSR